MRMVFSGKEGNIGIFCFPQPNVYVPRYSYAFQVMHFFFVSSINAYKCHIINFLLTTILDITG
jgi:hypothetical protein